VSGTTVRALVLGHFGQKIERKIDLKDTTKKRIKIKKCKGGDALGRRCLLLGRFSFAQPRLVSSISLGRFFSVRVRQKANLSETDPSPGTRLCSGHLTCSACTGFSAMPLLPQSELLGIAEAGPTNSVKTLMAT